MFSDVFAVLICSGPQLYECLRFRPSRLGGGLQHAEGKDSVGYRLSCPYLPAYVYVCSRCISIYIHIMFTQGMLGTAR